MKTKIFGLILFFFLSANIFAQQPTPTPVLYSEKTLQELERLQQHVLNSGYDYKQTAYLCNNIGPRLTGSAQAERAVQYVAEEMRKLGFEVRLQKLTVPHWVRGEEKGELIEFEGMAKGSTQKIVLTALGGSVATDANGLSAEVIVVSNYDELKALGADKIKGKIVLYNVKFDKRLAEQITLGDWDSPPYAASTGVDYAFSQDSKEIAFLRNPDKIEAISTNSDIYVVSLSGGTAKNITEKNKGYDVAPTYTSDGKYVIFRSQATAGFEADRWRIMRYNRQTGETVELTQGFDLQAEELAISPDNKTIYFTAMQRGLAPIFTVPVEPDFRLRIASHVKTLISEGFNSNLSITPDGKLVFVSSSITMPNEVFTADAKPNSKPTKLSAGNAELSFLQKPEELEWKGALNKTIHGFLTKPANFDASKKYPLLVLIHGGPQSAFNNSWGYRWNPQIFANAGYVVFQPNPRGSVGYGQKFVNEISADWAGKVYLDLMNGVAEVLKKPYIDKENIGAAGASYGGYMIDWILGHNNDPRFKFKALHSHAGVYNLENMATVTEETWFPAWEFKGMPWENPVNYQRWSPHRFANNFKTPTLITQGEIDYRVPVDQSLQLFTTLQLKGIESKLIVFPDEGHWILKPQNSIFWYGQVLGWFEKHLR